LLGGLVYLALAEDGDRVVIDGDDAGSAALSFRPQQVMSLNQPSGCSTIRFTLSIPEPRPLIYRSYARADMRRLDAASCRLLLRVAPQGETGGDRAAAVRTTGAGATGQDRAAGHRGQAMQRLCALRGVTAAGTREREDERLAKEAQDVLDALWRAPD
jgi:hypothetical protein